MEQSSQQYSTLENAFTIKATNLAPYFPSSHPALTVHTPAQLNAYTNIHFTNQQTNMPRYPRPEGFGPRGARDDRVGEILHDSDEEVEVRDRSPSPEWRPSTRQYTIPPAPPPSLEDIPKKRPGSGKTEAQIAEAATRVEDWIADVERADTRSSEDGRRQRLMRKARAVLLEFFRKK